MKCRILFSTESKKIFQSVICRKFFAACEVLKCDNEFLHYGQSHKSDIN